MTVEELVAAVNDGAPGDVVIVSAGTFELSAPLRPKAGMEIRGAGMGATVIRNATGWQPGNGGLDQDEGATRESVDCGSYLIDLGADNADFTLSNLTLTGPQVHGGLCGHFLDGLEVHHVEFESFLWAGVRMFGLENALIYDNRFFDAGNKSNVTTGSSGGALFLTYTSDSEIRNNRFSRSEGNDGYGVKGRQFRNVRIHHNTIDVNFAVELPFENDHTVDIDYNFLGGVISIPKYAGGDVPDGQYGFHIHHNYLNTSYAIEYQRNSVEVDHNLFDFSRDEDGGNLISGFDAVPADPGGTNFHDNLIRNPGRGIYWNEGVYNDFTFANNHVRGETTATPRTEGLFDFRSNRDGGVADWNSVVIRDNIFELTGTERDLMRNADARAAVVENNTLTGISDAAAYDNPDQGRPRGPAEPLCFRIGADEELTVDGWDLFDTPSPPPSDACGADPGESGSSGGTGESDGDTDGDGSGSGAETAGESQGGSSSEGSGTGNESGSSASGGGNGSGAGDAGPGTDGGTSAGANDGDDSGCACSTGAGLGPTGWAWVALCVFMVPRRRTTRRVENRGQCAARSSWSAVPKSASRCARL